jgi:hypothetical protein
MNGRKKTVEGKMKKERKVGMKKGGKKGRK